MGLWEKFLKLTTFLAFPLIIPPGLPGVGLRRGQWGGLAARLQSAALSRLLRFYDSMIPFSLDILPCHSTLKSWNKKVTL